jgi:hypothetical protein
MPLRRLLFAVTLGLSIGLAACSDDTTTSPNPPRLWERIVPVPEELPDLQAVSVDDGGAFAVGTNGFSMSVDEDDDWITRTSNGVHTFVATASTSTFTLNATDEGTVTVFGSNFINNETFDARWRAACTSWDGVLVVGDEGQALFTSDGESFDRFTLPTDADLTDCAYVYTFVVSDEDGYVWETQRDELDGWTRDTDALSGGIRSMWRTRVSIRTVAVGNDGALYRWDRDADAWVHEYSAGDAQFRYVNDGYAVGDGGLLVKGDGVIWNRIDLGTNVDLRSVARGSTTWVVGINGTCFGSQNTVEFTRRPVARPLSFTETHWTGETYVIGGWGRTGILLSEDGERWRRPGGAYPRHVNAIAGNGTRVVAAGTGHVYISDDLDTWTQWIVAPTGVSIRELVWTGSRFVGVHDYGIQTRFVSSATGEGFRPLTVTGIDENISKIAAFRGDVVAAGTLAGVFVIHADDEVISASAPNVLIRDFAVQGDYLYAVGGNEIWRTRDLEAWLPVYQGEELADSFTAIAGGRGMVAVTAANSVLESSDGLTWSDRRTVGTTHRLQDALWGSDGWVLVGLEGAIYVD